MLSLFTRYPLIYFACFEYDTLKVIRFKDPHVFPGRQHIPIHVCFRFHLPEIGGNKHAGHSPMGKHRHLFTSFHDQLTLCFSLILFSHLFKTQLGPPPSSRSHYRLLPQFHMFLIFVILSIGAMFYKS